ncbi:class A beta-lactamase [Williamsia serinedens]|uniref:Beta-lactamase class A n=1 Tax=Williamsia serinedens TaxID=391736 RepID=A0ABT1H3E3_9NOCA|nr:class A beta-lactamase [Williamsia serinedens]MCP2161711.1 beta-lactamase class A [Williamsia serinedens]
MRTVSPLAVLVPVLVALGVVAAPAQAAPSVDDQVQAIATSSGVEAGVYAQDLVTGRVIASVGADQRFPVLSMSKVYLAAAVLDSARRGLLRLDTPVPVRRQDIVANSPVTQTRVGKTMTYPEIATAALQQSDNTAANLMFAAIGGPTAVTAFALTAGDTATVMVRTETALNSAFPGDIRDTTVPQGWAAGLRSLLTGTRLDPRDRATLVGWMQGTQTSDKRFRADLPSGWTSADKTGTGDYGTANDGGLLLGPTGQRILLVVQTRASRFDADATPADAVIARIAALVARS